MGRCRMSSLACLLEGKHMDGGFPTLRWVSMLLAHMFG